MRIVSLLPSATEIICELGLGDDLVGVTHECDYPPSVAQLPKVTQTRIPHDASSGEIDAIVREQLKTEQALYSLNLPVLTGLAPDLIVTQALCDVCAVAEAEVTAAACMLPGRPRVLNLEPMSLNDVLQSIIEVGRAVGIEETAVAVVSGLRERIEVIAGRAAQLSRRTRMVLLEWLDPPFCSGHWSPELAQLAGGDELIGIAGRPSRRLNWMEILAADPEVLFIACCGFSTERTLKDLPALVSQPGWTDLLAVKTGRVYVTDGNAYFNRPGPRLVDSLEILASALHPEFRLPPALASQLRQLTERELEAGNC